MLLDTSGLLCFLNRKDVWFTRTQQFFGGATTRQTHSYVLAELIPVARSRGLPPALALGFVRSLANDRSVTVVYVDRALHERALGLLERRPDKRWSLCDAVSFELMQERGIREALTTDHHFEQAGFIRLLK